MLEVGKYYRVFYDGARILKLIRYRKSKKGDLALFQNEEMKRLRVGLVLNHNGVYWFSPDKPAVPVKVEPLLGLPAGISA